MRNSFFVVLFAIAINCIILDAKANDTNASTVEIKTLDAPSCESWTNNSSKEKRLIEARETLSALEGALDWARTNTHNDNAVEEITRRITAVRLYIESVNNNETATDTECKALEQSEAVTAYAAENISATQFAAAVDRNSKLGMFVNTEGKKLQGIPVIQKNLALVEKDANAGVTPNILGDENGRHGVFIFRAAIMTVQNIRARETPNKYAHDAPHSLT